MSKHYGIKYPFTAQDTENYYLDVNKDLKDKVRSLLMHIIFTPKGQKLRDPDFGTELIRFIFQPNDNETIEAIKSEVSEVVTKYISGVKINDLQVLSDETQRGIFVRVDYTVTQGYKTVNDSFVTKL